MVVKHVYQYFSFFLSLQVIQFTLNSMIILQDFKNAIFVNYVNIFRLTRPAFWLLHETTKTCWWNTINPKNYVFFSLIHIYFIFLVGFSHHFDMNTPTVQKYTISLKPLYNLQRDIVSAILIPAMISIARQIIKKKTACYLLT